MRLAELRTCGEAVEVDFGGGFLVRGGTGDVLD